MINIELFCFSLTSTHKFDGAEGNLKKLLEKNHSTSNESKKMIANLMILIKDLLFEDSTKNLSDVSVFKYIHSGPKKLVKLNKSKKKVREIAFLAVLNFFLAQKIDFWPFLKLQKMEFGQNIFS